MATKYKKILKVKKKKRLVDKLNILYMIIDNQLKDWQSDYVCVCVYIYVMCEILEEKKKKMSSKQFFI